MPDAEGGCYRISRQEDTYRVGQCPVPEMRTGHFARQRAWDRLGIYSPVQSEP